MKNQKLVDPDDGWLIRSWIGFRKFVPTDLHFYCMYPGDRVEIRCHQCAHGSSWAVAVGGTEASTLVRFLPTEQEALEIYNRLTYIQSGADLVDFLDDLPGANNNGWPHGRPTAEEEEDMERRQLDRYDAMVSYEEARAASRRRLTRHQRKKQYG